MQEMAEWSQTFPTKLAECRKISVPEYAVLRHILNSWGRLSCPSIVYTPGDGYSDQISAGGLNLGVNITGVDNEGG